MTAHSYEGMIDLIMIHTVVIKWGKGKRRGFYRREMKRIGKWQNGEEGKRRGDEEGKTVSRMMMGS